MAYRDYEEGRSGPGGGYEHRDRLGGEGRRGWMDRARDYVERARDLGRDVYERAQAERYARGGPGQARGYDAERYGHGDYDRGPADRGPGAMGGYGGPQGAYGAASGGPAAYDGRPSHAGRGSRHYRRTDARIEEEVHEVLMRHHDIDATDIDVRVENGEVTLTGAVEDRRTRRLVEEVVEQLPGVRDVHNQLRARGGTPGALGGAAMDALDPTRPTRDPGGTPGTGRYGGGGMPGSGAGIW